MNTDAADTSQGAVGVLDRKGVVRVTHASGTRVFLPFIPGVGICRLRYPIMPVHGEGSAVWKELEATKDVLMKSKTYGYLYREPLGGGSGVVPTEPPQKPLTLRMEDDTKTPPGAHVHEVTLTPAEVEMAKKGTIIPGMLTSTGAGHQHTIDIQWKKNKWRIAQEINPVQRCSYGILCQVISITLPTTSTFAKKREWTPYLKNLILAVCRSRQLRNTCVIFNFKS